MRDGGPVILFCILLLAAGLAACTEPSNETWRQIQAEGFLRVGLDPTYPPFEVAAGEEIRGFDVDLARALASDLGLKARFTPIAYDGLYDALATGQVDVLVSALVIRPDQMEDFAYSQPYFNAGQVLLVPAQQENIDKMEDLSGRVLAVELGSQGHYEATRWQRRIRDLAIETYHTAGAALAAVAAGRSAAALTDNISARLYLRESDALRRAGPPVTVEPFAVVVRKEDERLLKELNQSLERLEEAGRIRQIRERWLDAPLFSLFF